MNIIKNEYVCKGCHGMDCGCKIKYWFPIKTPNAKCDTWVEPDGYQKAMDLIPIEDKICVSVKCKCNKTTNFLYSCDGKFLKELPY